MFAPRLVMSALVFAGLLCTTAGHAYVLDETADGIAFIEGGIGEEEVGVLEAERPRYSLRVRTAARHSGAYLADVFLRIRDGVGHVVFERRLQAPWLLIALPPGRYEIEGVHDGDVDLRSVTIGEHAHGEAVLYFPVDGESAPHRAGDD